MCMLARFKKFRCVSVRMTLHRDPHVCAEIVLSPCK